MTNNKPTQDEVWKDVVGYEGLYQISNKGNVKSFVKNNKNGIILKPTVGTFGYSKVSFVNDSIKTTHNVHRLIAECFLLKSGKVVNHINGIKTDNRLENIEYSSQRENINHAKIGKNLTGAYLNKPSMKWQSRISVGGKQIQLGTFKTEIEAHQAYKNACKELNEDKYCGEKS